MKDNIVVISQPGISIESFCASLGIEERNAIAIRLYADSRNILGLSPDNTTIFYLWTRVNPISTHLRSLICELKNNGHRIIVVTDW